MGILYINVKIKRNQAAMSQTLFHNPSSAPYYPPPTAENTITFHAESLTGQASFTECLADLSL